MNRKYYYLICSSFFVCIIASNEFSLVYDEIMQQFREDILLIQYDTMIQLDISFFKFYNKFYAQLNNSIEQPFIVLSDEFAKSCLVFPYFTLENQASRRLINICDDASKFFTRVVPFAEKTISSYYPNPETLTSETILEILAVDYFKNMDKYLEYVLPTYNQNPSCVVPALKKFPSIYRKPIEEMMRMNEKMFEKVHKGVRRNFKFIERAASKLFNVSKRLTTCSNETVIDTFSCLNEFINFDCTRKKSGCGQFYKSLYTILYHLRKIDEFHKSYEDSFDRVFKAIERADESLLRWSVQVEKCIIY